MRSFCDNIRLRFENGQRRRRSNQGIGHRILRYRRCVRAEKLEFVAAGSLALVSWRLAVMMTRGHIAGRHVTCGIGRITYREST